MGVRFWRRVKIAPGLTLNLSESGGSLPIGPRGRILFGRAAVVQRLTKGLNVNPATVPVVKAIFRMFATLLDFAENTRRLPETTLAMRDVFEYPKSPEHFLFAALAPRERKQADALAHQFRRYIQCGHGYIYMRYISLSDIQCILAT